MSPVLKLTTILLPLFTISVSESATSNQPSCRPHSSCPEPCSCYCDMYDSIIVDCSNRSLTQIPTGIPSRIFRLLLDGNNFTTVDEYISPPISVKHVFLNNSGIRSFKEGWFSKSLRNVSKIRLRDNFLNEVSFGMFHDPSNSTMNSNLSDFENPIMFLTKIRLDNNNISKVDLRAFSAMPLLKLISINDNKLVNPRIWEWLPTSVKTLYAANNSYQCDCKYWEEFKQHLMREPKEMTLTVKRNILQDGVIIRCLTADKTSFLFSDYYNQFCVNDPRVLQIKIIAGCVVGFLLLVIAVLGIAFKYSLHMRVWAYSKFGVRFYRQSKEDEEKPFDAFISYCSCDAEFVAKDLEPGLSAYRLCIHDRHFPAGAFITDTIIRAVDKSCRTVLVLSPESTRSEFCSFEFKLAHYKQLKDQSCRLIIIKVGEIPLDSLNKELLYYLKTHTYLTWGENNFWAKFYYSLPDPGRKAKMGDSDFKPLLQSMEDVWSSGSNSINPAGSDSI